MHESRRISSVIWKDKKAVVLLSTHALPIEFHHEDTNFMQGVDVADQLRASYTCQTCSHKWWHRPFFFLLDQTIINMYIYYLAILGQGRIGRAQMTHLQFKTNFCEALTCNWPHRRRDEPVQGAAIHVPKWTTLRRICVVCTAKRCNYYCECCENKYMCLNKGCFETYHTHG